MLFLQAGNHFVDFVETFKLAFQFHFWVTPLGVEHCHF